MASPAPPTPLLVICDFDETAATQNAARLLLRRFRNSRVAAVERAYRDGRLTFREYQEQAFDALSAGPAEIAACAAASVKLRAGLAEAVEATHRAGGEFRVVSAGLRTYIGPVMARQGLGAVPVTAVRVRRTRSPAGGLEYDYPEADAACDPGWGVCKCRTFEQALRAGAHVVFIGDGLRSDACAAARASKVFGRGRLLEYCRANGIAAAPLDDFHDVADYVRDWRSGAAQPGDEAIR